eukprot:9486787-Pyramimonas_sp.AAC.1
MVGGPASGCMVQHAFGPLRGPRRCPLGAVLARAGAVLNPRGCPENPERVPRRLLQATFACTRLRRIVSACSLEARGQ